MHVDCLDQCTGAAMHLLARIILSDMRGSVSHTVVSATVLVRLPRSIFAPLAGDQAMAVLQSAALHSIERMTPYNIATTVWALSRLLRSTDRAASGGLGTPADQQAAEGPRPAAPAGASSNGSLGRTPAAVSPRRPSLLRPSYPAASVVYASSDSDAGVFSSCEDLVDGLTLEALQQPARATQQGASHADASQLVDGLAAATARCAGQFKPAHVGDVLWGFGCLGVSPRDAVVTELLSAAAAAPSVQSASATCALVGLAEMTGIRNNEGQPSWMTEHRQTLGLLATTAGAGFASLRATSPEQARKPPFSIMLQDVCTVWCPVLLAIPSAMLERLTWLMQSKFVMSCLRCAAGVRGGYAGRWPAARHVRLQCRRWQCSGVLSRSPRRRPVSGSLWHPCGSSRWGCELAPFVPLSCQASQTIALQILPPVAEPR